MTESWKIKDFSWSFGSTNGEFTFSQYIFFQITRKSIRLFLS